MALRCAVVMIVFVVLWIRAVDLRARAESKGWIVLSNCRLIANPANDGDSFHVSAGLNEYIFRLYMVDAPETDALTPARLVEQAKYFGITVPQTIEVGRAAKEFTRQKLSEPFTVFTHLSDAMGQSKLERFYAYVQTKDGDLGEQLVRSGLARIYGFKAAPPSLQNSRQEMQKLQQFESEAKREKLGGWGINAGRLNLRAQTPAIFSFFALPNDTQRQPALLPMPFSRRSPMLIPSTSPPRTSASHSKEKTPLGRIDINTATEKELTTVPGIGHVIAARIIAARPFRSADDLKRMSGIGDKKYSQVRPYFRHGLELDEQLGRVLLEKCNNTRDTGVLLRAAEKQLSPREWDELKENLPFGSNAIAAYCSFARRSKEPFDDLRSALGHVKDALATTGTLPLLPGHSEQQLHGPEPNYFVGVSLGVTKLVVGFRKFCRQLPLNKWNPQTAELFLRSLRPSLEIHREVSQLLKSRT